MSRRDCPTCAGLGDVVVHRRVVPCIDCDGGGKVVPGGFTLHRLADDVLAWSSEEGRTDEERGEALLLASAVRVLAPKIDRLVGR